MATYNYNVQFSTASNGPWSNTGNVATTTDKVSGLAANTSYFFQITPFDVATNLFGPPSVIGPFATSLNPTAPGNLVVSNVQANQVTLTWTAAV